MANSSKRNRRSPEQLIADLKAKIASIQARAERQKAKKDPALRHMTAAVRSIDKALAETSDAATRKALDDVRSTLAACLSLSGSAPTGRTRAVLRPHANTRVEPKEVLRYLSQHPGSRCEDVASAVGADTKAVGPVLRELKAKGKARSEGQARGTRYFVAES